MTLKMTHLHLNEHSLDALVAMVLAEAMRETNKRPGEIATQLGWKMTAVNAILGSHPFVKLGGSDAMSMTIVDFEGKSPLRARHAVEVAIIRSLVASLPAENCNRLIGRMLHVREYRIRRIRRRAGLPSARELRAARLLRKRTQDTNGDQPT